MHWTRFAALLGTGASVVIASVVACSLDDAPKDRCNTDSDCNPGRFCVASICSSSPVPPGTGTSDAAPFAPSDGAPAADDAGSDALAQGPDSGGARDAGTRDVDRAWAAWPLPPESPPNSNYTTTPDTVVDQTTHLVWERSPGSAKLTWQHAHDRCDALVLGGYDDWRLPTRIELLSIVDYGRYNPAINVDAFPQTVQGFWWTSSPRLDLDSQPVWVVDFSLGDINSIVGDIAQLARCVRGG